MEIKYENKIRNIKGSIHIQNRQILNSREGQEFEINKWMMNSFNSAIFLGYKIEAGRINERPCAIKFLRQIDDQHMDRFENEVRIHSVLKHESIIDYHGNGIFMDERSGVEVPYIITELGNENLYSHIVPDTSGNYRNYVNPKDFKRIARQMCNSLKYIHGLGIIHRDIKPQNYVTSTKTSSFIRMIDFGICKYVNESSSTRPLDFFTRINDKVGPAYFSSPELIEYGYNKRVDITYKSDIFQLGMVLWFVATGKINSGKPSRKDDPFKGKLYSIFDRIIEPDPNDRPEIDEIIQMIDEI